MNLLLLKLRLLIFGKIPGFSGRSFVHVAGSVDQFVTLAPQFHNVILHNSTS